MEPSMCMPSRLRSYETRASAIGAPASSTTRPNACRALEDDVDAARLERRAVLVLQSDRREARELEALLELRAALGRDLQLEVLR